jgi:hypothetical protein
MQNSKVLDMMSQMLMLQKQILIELEHTTDVEKKETMAEKIIGKKASVFINSDYLEEIEKYYFMLDKINNNTYSILEMSKKQKDKLYKYSANIRKYLHKEREVKNDNKFINVLSSHFNGSFNNIQLDPAQHHDIYDSVRRYHELHTDKPNYIIQKTVDLMGNHIDIPIVTSLGNIPCMFNWYVGDDQHEAGIYISISPELIVQVPFPDLICKNSKNFKHKSVPCKYKTLENCQAKQAEYSKMYNTIVRQCNFVHIGESFIKIGSDFRCPNLPSFGAHDSLQKDMTNIHLSDIKTILMNSTSDLLLIKLWQLYHKNLGNMIFTNIDKLVM